MTRIALAALAASSLAFAAQAGEPVSFEGLDTNGDGFVTQSEYVEAVTADGAMSETDALVTFAALDSDADGTLSAAEIDAAHPDESEAEVEAIDQN